MKELGAWVKIKKYTDDEGKPVCEGCLWAHSQCKHADMRHLRRISDYIPGPTCPVWHGESKSEWQPIEKH